jgi:hypothetical protein
MTLTHVKITYTFQGYYKDDPKQRFPFNCEQVVNDYDWKINMNLMATAWHVMKPPDIVDPYDYIELTEINIQVFDKEIKELK